MWCSRWREKQGEAKAGEGKGGTGELISWVSVSQSGFPLCQSSPRAPERDTVN